MDSAPLVVQEIVANILDRLRGGDRRSTGNADAVAEEIATDPQLFAAVFSGLYDDDPIVRMRSADAVEKASKQQPDLLAGYAPRVLALLETAGQQEICWHMAQISPRLDLSKGEQKRMIELLKEQLSHPSRIVRVSALDAMTRFAERDESFVDEAKRIIKSQMESGIPSVLSRGRRLLQRLERK